MSSSPPKPPVKAIFFDFMGTCLDWHTSVASSLPLPSPLASSFALTWRAQFFDELAHLDATGQPPEDIDLTLSRVLTTLLTNTFTEHAVLFTPTARSTALAAWHTQPAWPDVSPALSALRSIPDLELFVLANGTPRLQLDLVRSSGLRFDMLFSSQLLGAYKPSKAAYERALEMVGREVGESVMVAAHAYDLRAARGVGMRTVYVRRWTDDVGEDMEGVKGKVDAFLEDMSGLADVVRKMQDGEV